MPTLVLFELHLLTFFLQIIEIIIYYEIPANS